MGTVPAPYTPTAGDDATQARVLTWADAANYLLGNATSGGSKRPLCVLRQTVAQALTAGASAALTFDTEDVDYDNGHSTVTNTSRYTAATAGWYLVAFIASMSAGAGNRQGYLRINGTTAVNGSSVFVNTNSQVAGARLVFLNVGDYIEVMANAQNAISTDNSLQSQSMMSVEWRSN